MVVDMVWSMFVVYPALARIPASPVMFHLGEWTLFGQENPHSDKVVLGTTHVASICLGVFVIFPW